MVFENRRALPRFCLIAFALCFFGSVKVNASVPWLQTQNGRLLDSAGNYFHGHGANIDDVQGCGACSPGNYSNNYNYTEVNRRMDVLVDKWGANFIRLLLEDDRRPGTTSTSNITDDSQYMAAIKAIVDHAASKNIYVLLSVWQNPLVPNDNNNPGGSTSTNTWWPTQAEQPALQTLVDYFYSYSNVLFGVTNEPERNYDGAQDATVWSLMNTSVQTIRDRESSHQANTHIIVVQGTRGWAGDISYYVNHPITAGGGVNIAYEVHNYSPSSTFAASFINPSASIPVIIGEFGPSQGQGQTISDAQQLMSQARSHHIPYLAWDFHFNCPPNLIQDTRGSVNNDNCGVGMPIAATDWGNYIYNDLQTAWPTSQGGQPAGNGSVWVVPNPPPATSSGSGSSSGNPSGTTAAGTSNQGGAIAVSQMTATFVD